MTSNKEIPSVRRATLAKPNVALNPESAMFQRRDDGEGESGGEEGREGLEVVYVEERR